MEKIGISADEKDSIIEVAGIDHAVNAAWLSIEGGKSGKVKRVKSYFREVLKGADLDDSKFLTSRKREIAHHAEMQKQIERKKIIDEEPDGEPMPEKISEYVRDMLNKKEVS